MSGTTTEGPCRGKASVRNEACEDVALRVLEHRRPRRWIKGSNCGADSCQEAVSKSSLSSL